ncbi:MAG: hypothetical protein ACO4AL_06460 [Steroidobacteraceae bacterium]|jgi:uncharacterized membrane protein (DUF485 family)
MQDGRDAAELGRRNRRLALTLGGLALAVYVAFLLLKAVAG